MKTKNKIILLSTLATIILLLLAGYFALIYVPSWYQPAYVDPMDQQKLRDDFTSLTAKFNKGMQHLKPFDLAVDARDINRFISGLAYLDPSLKDSIPANVMDPAVQLEDDYFKAGAVVEQDGKKVFASLWLKIVPLENWLVIEDFKVKVGLYSIPQDVVKKEIEKLAKKFNQSLPDIRKILETNQYANHFR
jgi:hypothetical protein